MGKKRRRADGDGSHVHARKYSTFLCTSPPRSLLSPNIDTFSVEYQKALQRRPVRNFVPTGNLQSQALNTLFSDEIPFLPASVLTVADEKKMAPILCSSRMLLVDGSQKINGEQLADCDKTNQISGVCSRQAASLPVPSLPFTRPLQNNGNRCYRNAILQALLHIPKLVNMMRIEHINCHLFDCTLCRFKGLCFEYCCPSGNTRAVNNSLVSLEDSLKCTQAFNTRRWNFGVEHDAGEFIVKFMDAIVESNPKIGKSFNAMLGHIPVSTKTCSVCNVTTKTPKPEEQQWVLLVGWERPMTLEHILRTRTLSDCTFQLECDTCKSIHKSSRKERLWTTPDVLIIQLQRFEMKANGKMRKKMDAIVYPVELDLTEFSEADGHVRYGLQAVVHHCGSLNEGHYVAVVKGRSGRWEWIDDMARPQMRSAPLEAALSPTNGYTPYLLFYVKLEGRINRTKKEFATA